MAGSARASDRGPSVPRRRRGNHRRQPAGSRVCDREWSEFPDTWRAGGGAGADCQSGAAPDAECGPGLGGSPVVDAALLQPVRRRSWMGGARASSEPSCSSSGWTTCWRWRCCSIRAGAGRGRGSSSCTHRQTRASLARRRSIGDCSGTRRRSRSERLRSSSMCQGRLGTRRLRRFASATCSGGAERRARAKLACYSGRSTSTTPLMRARNTRVLELRRPTATNTLDSQFQSSRFRPSQPSAQSSLGTSTRSSSAQDSRSDARIPSLRQRPTGTISSSLPETQSTTNDLLPSVSVCLRGTTFFHLLARLLCA